MARMIPPYYTEEIKSTGEKQFFDLLRHDPATLIGFEYQEAICRSLHKGKRTG